VAFRKYLKLSIKELEGAFQLLVEKTNGKQQVIKSFKSLEEAESYRVKFVEGCVTQRFQ